MRHLLNELRRRRVFQVVAAYAAFAFVLAQAADIVVPALELPPVVMRALVLGLGVGFPLLVVLAWSLGAKGEGVVRSAGPDRAHASILLGWRPLLRRGLIVGTAGALSLGAGWVLWQRPGVADPGVDPDLIAVIPFRASVDPSLTYLEEGMMDLVGATLAGAGTVRIVDPRRVLGSVRHAGAAPGRPPTGDEAAALALGLGAGRFLSGGVVGHPGALVITAELRESTNGRLVSQARVEGPVDSLGVLGDRLGVQLLAMGAGEGGERLSSLAEIPTPALQLYLAGRRAYRLGNYREAADRYSAALALDPSFALAGLGILHLSGWVDLPSGILGRSASLVLRERDRLGFLDRLAVDEILGPHYPHASSGSDLIEAARRLAEAAPDRAEGWYRYGERLYHIGLAAGISDAHAQAVRAFERAVQLDSTFGPPIPHRMEHALAEGDVASVLLMARSAGGLAANGIAADQLRWLTALARRDGRALAAFRADIDGGRVEDLAYVIHTAQLGPFDLATAERAAAALERTAITRTERWQAASEARVLARNRGRPLRADSAMSRGLRGASEEEVATFWIRRIQDVLFWDGRPGDADEALVRLAPLEDQAEEPGSLALLQDIRCWTEQWRIRQGNLERTEETIRRVAAHAANPRYPGSVASLCAALLEAALAHHRDDPDAPARLGSLDALARTAPPVPTALLHAANLTAAGLFEARGDPERALAAVRRRYHLYSDPEPIFLSTLLREEGSLALRVGDRDGAVRAYRHLLELRNDPEPALAGEVHELRRTVREIAPRSKRGET